MALVAIVLVLAACGGPSHGKIEAKSYHRPYSYTSLNCALYRTSGPLAGSCSLWLPHTHYVSASYQFKLKTSQHEGWTDVPSQAYLDPRYAIGAQYP
jgi:hypothetical protein